MQNTQGPPLHLTQPQAGELHPWGPCRELGHEASVSLHGSLEASWEADPYVHGPS